jgi:hypothetical protein
VRFRGASGWRQTHQWNYPGGNVPHVDFLNLHGAQEVMVVARFLTFTANSRLCLTVSDDNGASFYTTSSYRNIDQAGNDTGANQLVMSATADQAGPKSLVGIIRGFSMPVWEGRVASGHSTDSGAMRFFADSDLPLNAVRVAPLAGNINGQAGQGRIGVYARY